ncbi:uncharacterized protein LOC108028932 [Drosophila biarmipes]|uniref:uncharacterized protein LOC108028932 n=1 Tax=Drosophila biarmipes TaxID=125945 RepID=UPI0021CC4F39|nr:uncharacterized protein LOC108028932 [Drosophila biarmipes]
MKLLIALVALLALCLSTAQKAENYSFTSRLLCSYKNGKRHCVPCSTSNGATTCEPGASSASSQSSGLPNNGQNGIEVGKTKGTAIEKIEDPGNGYHSDSAQSNGPQGSGNIGHDQKFNHPNYGNNRLVGYSPMYNLNTNRGGIELGPTQKPLEPAGNYYYLNAAHSRGFQGNANGVSNHGGNINNGGSTSAFGSYIDGPDNIPSFD